MKHFLLAILFTLGGPLPAATDGVRVADLAWLAGNWRGTLANGAIFEAHYSAPTGGTIVSSSKEVRHGRTTAIELELFHEQDHTVIYQPFPNGKKSEHSFPLIEFSGEATRAVFENKEHDFPQVFVFHRVAFDVLTITLRGPGKDGTTKEIRYELKRVP